MSPDKASDVSGPVATMTGLLGLAAGISGISSRTIVTRRCAASVPVTVSANRSRSTANAAPAGTRLASAARITSESSRRISSFSRPTALSSLSPRKEFEQTSSASRSVLWTAVGRTGRISYSVTGTPCDAACQAASLPARPPPMMRSMELRGGIRQFVGSGVVAILVGAEDLPPALLRRLLDQVRRGALRALLVDRPVPEHEIAVRIVRAAEEDLAAPRFALDDLAALFRIFRAHHAGRLVLHVLALRIAGARGELAEAALLDDQVRTAARALLVEDLIRLGRLETALLGGDELSRRLALGIAGAGEELSEAAALDRHRLAA